MKSNKSPWVSVIFFVILIFLGSLTMNNFNFSFLPVKADTWTWQDDFTSRNARWDWNYYFGTGYHICPTIIDGYTCVENGITKESSSSSYSDCNLRSLISFPATDTVVLEVRAKCSISMFTGSGKGTQGIGFWEGIGQNMIFFVDISEDSSSIWRGFRALMVRDGTRYIDVDISNIDITQWHIYYIEMSPSGTIMKIDGATVASSQYTPVMTALTEMDCWVDNQVALGLSNLKLDVDEKIYVDYINFYAGTSQNPVEAPSAPTNLKATAGSSQITLIWSAPSSDGGATIEDYKIYKGTSSGGESSTAFATVDGSTLTYIDKAVSTGYTYYYKVTAVNSVGESPLSNEANALLSLPTTGTMSVTVKTDKTTYSRGSTVTTTVTVKDATTLNPIKGVTVKLTIYYPNNLVAANSIGITDAAGTVQFRYRTSYFSMRGIYRDTATASLTGYQTGKGQTTFTVN